MALNDSHAVSVSAGQPLTFWDLATGQQRASLQLGGPGVTCARFDERYIITAAGSLVSVWDIKSNDLCLQLAGHTDEVGQIFNYKDRVASGSEDCTVRVSTLTLGVDAKVWSLLNGECIRVFEGHAAAVTSLHMTADHVVSGSVDSTVKLWCISAGTLERTFSGHTGAVFCVQSDNRFVVSGGADNLIRVWDMSTGQCLRTLAGHHEGVVCLQFDCEKVISGSSDKTIKVWDIQTGYCMYSIQEV
jgi:WD40 repeat protein